MVSCRHVLARSRGLWEVFQGGRAASAETGLVGTDPPDVSSRLICNVSPPAAGNVWEEGAFLLLGPQPCQPRRAGPLGS